MLDEGVAQPLLVTISAITLASETVRSILKIDDIVSSQIDVNNCFLKVNNISVFRSMLSTVKRYLAQCETKRNLTTTNKHDRSMPASFSAFALHVRSITLLLYNKIFSTRRILCIPFFYCFSRRERCRFLYGSLLLYTFLLMILCEIYF